MYMKNVPLKLAVGRRSGGREGAVCGGALVMFVAFFTISQEQTQLYLNSI